MFTSKSRNTIIIVALGVLVIVVIIILAFLITPPEPLVAPTNTNTTPVTETLPKPQKVTNTQTVLGTTAQLTYPLEWGQVQPILNVWHWLTFSKLSYLQRGQEKPSDDTIAYHASSFKLAIINQDEIKAYSEVAVAPTINPTFFEVMKGKFTNFSADCSETMYGYGTCYNLEKVTIGGQEYLTYTWFGWFGDWKLERVWLRFVGDKAVMISADLSTNNVIDTQGIEKKLYPDTTSGINQENLKKITYSDFHVKAAMLLAVESAVKDFLSQLTIEESQTTTLNTATNDRYVNKQYGFEITVPGIGTFTPDEAAMTYPYADKPMIQYQLNDAVSVNVVRGVSAKEYAKATQENTGPYLIGQADIQINGLPAKYLELGYASGYRGYNYIFDKNGDAIVVGIYVLKTDTSYKKIIDSFKLL